MLIKSFIHFFNELDKRQGTMLKSTLYNLPNKELCSKILDSFFNKLDTRKGTTLKSTLYNLPI